MHKSFGKHWGNRAPFQVAEDRGVAIWKTIGWDELLGSGSRETWPTGTWRKTMHPDLHQDDFLQGHELLQVLNLLPSTHYVLRSIDKRVTVTVAVVRDGYITDIISLREARGQVPWNFLTFPG